MKVSLQNLCPRCKGKGYDEQHQRCDECDGTGLIRDVEESSHRNLKRKKQRDEI